MTRVAVLTLTLAILSGLVGCNAKPKPVSFDVRVQLDPTWASQDQLNGTVDVNFIAVKPGDEIAWNNAEVDNWWRKDEQRTQYAEQGILHTMTFRDDDRGSKTLTRDDPIWDKWIKENGAHVLLVIANPPLADPTLATNVRVLKLPLYRKKYEYADGMKQRELGVTVYRNRIDLENVEVVDTD